MPSAIVNVLLTSYRMRYEFWRAGVAKLGPRKGQSNCHWARCQVWTKILHSVAVPVFSEWATGCNVWAIQYMSWNQLFGVMMLMRLLVQWCQWFKHYTRCRNQRKGKYLCICTFLASCTWFENRLSKKNGLYTSPDLRCIRERIQINDKPILEDAFTKYFFEVWERLSTQNSQTMEETPRLPRYLQLLALIAFHTFIREQTQAVIFETHHGGEYDATNVVQKPIVTGVTSIGLDHVAQLGPSLENIAWHKAGIFKHGAPAFSAPQEPQPKAVLQGRVTEKDVALKFVPVRTTLPADALSLAVPVQRINCSLAVALTEAFLERRALEEHRQLTQEDISEGVKNFSWPGRFEIIQDGMCEWFLDGAHNDLSVKQVAMWFAQTTTKKQRHVR